MDVEIHSSKCNFGKRCGNFLESNIELINDDHDHQICIVKGLFSLWCAIRFGSVLDSLDYYEAQYFLLVLAAEQQ